MEENGKKLLKAYTFGEQTVFYLLENGNIGMTVLPTAIRDRFTPDGNWKADSLVQLKLVGDGYPPAYSQGMTMYGSVSSEKLKYVSQEATEDPEGTTVTTVLKSNRVTAWHTLRAPRSKPYVWINTRVENTSGETQRLEYLTSFAVCGFSAADAEERVGDLNFYRLQSRWSAEGKLLKQSMTELNMEPSWSRHGVNAIRYGQVGSMPVRGYFPWGVAEDTKYGWCLGAQLYYPGSWQMEIRNKEERIAFAGGLADREFGHFMKNLAPGEALEAPRAVLAAAMGGVDEVSACLTEAQEEALVDLPETEKDLPVIYNEYCTTWGNPTAENLEKIIDKIRGRGFAYLVIDAGWYASRDEMWFSKQGDWQVSEDRFPGGFGETVRKIREAGMIPGLWIEMELAGGRSKAFWEKEDLFLHRDGLVLEDGNRFWDMKKPETVAYLDETVIGTLKNNGFGYIKVDYNGNYGIGADGAESLGEALRQSVLASQDYFKRIREKIPEIVIESCASGGHRLEPSMMGVCSMASFSDAHECVHIPVIAANVQRAILPRQSQIWAVLRGDDSARRLYWSMINGFLGRLCVSGEIYDLDDDQWAIVDRGIAFYKECAPVIRDGRSRRYGDENLDYNHLKGWQAVVREGKKDAEGLCLAVIHRFAGNDGEKLSVPLPAGDWKIRGQYGENEIRAEIKDGKLELNGMGEFAAVAILLEKQ